MTKDDSLALLNEMSSIIRRLDLDAVHVAATWSGDDFGWVQSEVLTRGFTRKRRSILFHISLWISHRRSSSTIIRWNLARHNAFSPSPCVGRSRVAHNLTPIMSYHLDWIEWLTSLESPYIQKAFNCLLFLPQIASSHRRQLSCLDRLLLKQVKVNQDDDLIERRCLKHDELSEWFRMIISQLICYLVLRFGVDSLWLGRRT
jgi:hypothetical protein